MSERGSCTPPAILSLPHAFRVPTCQQKLWGKRHAELQAARKQRASQQQQQRRQDRELLQQSPGAAKALSMATSGRRLSALGTTSSSEQGCMQYALPVWFCSGKGLSCAQLEASFGRLPSCWSR